MSEVIINFKSEEREGIVAVGTYIIDAAKRLGVNLECDCNDEETETKGSCAVMISGDKTLLSSPTKLEMELLSSEARKNGERLACQTKIEKSGEVTVMVVKKKVAEEETTVEDEVNQEEYKKKFEELPLEQKISNLMELEAIALSETFSFVMNSPYAAVGKVMDVLAGFGLKMEQEDQEAKRPDEHVEKESPAEEKSEAKEKTDEKKSSATSRKKPASKSATSRKTTTKKTTARKTTRKKATPKATEKKEDDKES